MHASVPSPRRKETTMEFTTVAVKRVVFLGALFFCAAKIAFQIYEYVHVLVERMAK
jgi:hypothetical protein